MVTGSMVIGKTSSHERANGAVAVVHLYGPRGGGLGSTPIDKSDAREAINRLQAQLDNDGRAI